MINSDDCHHFLQTTKGIAREAGKLIIEAWGRPKEYECKDGNCSNLVTKTDRQVEEFIFGELRRHFSGHKYSQFEGSKIGFWGKKARIKLT